MPTGLKAVILCAGQGRRLQPLTNNLPKCLLPIKEKSILEHSLENTQENGIDDIFLVTGYRSHLIEDVIKQRGFSCVRFIYNDKYSTTNTAFSLNLALKYLDSDFILMNGDVFFDKHILKELIDHPQKNCVVVDSAIHLNEEEVKVIACNDRVVRISKELATQDCLGEAIGINKISKETIGPLKKIYDNLEKRNGSHHFFEIGFDRIISDHTPFGIMQTQRPWVEIDTIKDYEYARNEIFPKIFG